MKFRIALMFLLYVMPFISEANENECGVYAMKQALSICGVPTNYRDLKTKLQVSDSRGASFMQINNVAHDLSVKTNPIRITPEDLLRLQKPAIAFVRKNHFVTIAISDPKERSLFILDQNRRPEWLSLSEFEKIWNGEVITFEPSEPAEGPSLWVPSYSVDFGTFYGVTAEKRTMTVLNVGDKPLVLEKAKFSCNCAKVKFSPEKIEPHGYGTIDFIFDTSFKQNGEFSVRMYLTTNEGRDKPWWFQLKGGVFRQAILLPSYFTLGDVMPDEKEREFTSYMTLGSDYTGSIRARENESGLKWVSGNRLPGKDNVFEVKTRLDMSKVKPDEYGRFFSNILIETDHKQYQYLELGVIGNKLQELESMPRSLFLPACTPGKKVKKQIKIINRSLNDPVISFSNNENLRATLKDDLLQVEITPPTKEGLFIEDIDISAGTSSLKVPVKGIVNSK
jgi:hypothetical protein